MKYACYRSLLLINVINFNKILYEVFVASAGILEEFAYVIHADKEGLEIAF